MNSVCLITMTSTITSEWTRRLLNSCWRGWGCILLSRHLRKPKPPEQKLAITLRYLASSEEFKSLKFHFRVHSRTIAQFIHTVSRAVLSHVVEEQRPFLWIRKMKHRWDTNFLPYLKISIEVAPPTWISLVRVQIYQGLLWHFSDVAGFNIFQIKWVWFEKY